MKRAKLYMTADEVATLRLSTGPRRDDATKLAQERDWPAYVASLGASKPMPVQRVDVARLAAHFRGE